MVRLPLGRCTSTSSSMRKAATGSGVPTATSGSGVAGPGSVSTGAGAPSVAVVDWQTCTHGSGLADVAYFIGAGLDPALRRSVERGLVESYHDGLVASGVRHYGMERCWWEYRRGSWAGLLMAVGASMLVEQTERGDEMFVTMATRHATHALDLDAIGTLTG